MSEWTKWSSRGGDSIRTGWRDLTSSINAARVTGANQPTWTQYDGGVYGYSFSPTVLNECWPDPFHIDHDYKENTILFPHVHFSTLGTDTGVVRFGIDFVYAKGHGQEAFSDVDTIYLEQAASATAKMHQIVEGTVAADTWDGEALGVETDGLIICRLFRDAAHASDTCTDAVFIHTMDLHYQADHYCTENKAPPFD